MKRYTLFCAVVLSMVVANQYAGYTEQQGRDRELALLDLWRQGPQQRYGDLIDEAYEDYLYSTDPLARRLQEPVSSSYEEREMDPEFQIFRATYGFDY